MNRDNIIRMAREAGWQYADGDDGYNPLWRFAALVAAAEREACAKVCARGWVGLKDEEIKTLWDDHIIPVFNKNGISPFVFARTIEAKLKEKNK